MKSVIWSTYLPGCLLGLALSLGCSAPPESESEPAPAPANEDVWNIEQIGNAVTSDGQVDLGGYSKLAPWPNTDGRYFYSGCYDPAPLVSNMGEDRCFLTVDLETPDRPVRLATVYGFDRTASPSPPPDHVVWSPTYPFPNLPVQAPCMVDWDNPGISAGTTRPACWDPGWNTHTHYVSQGPAKLLAVNQERYRGGTDRQASNHGVKFYDVSDPAAPVFLSYWESPSAAPDPDTGVMEDARGTHHFNFSGPYLYLGATYEGYVGRILVILDLTDPRRPVEAAKWWIPGQKTPEEDAVRDWVQTPNALRTPIVDEGGKLTKHVAMHYATIYGNRAYLSYNQAGLVILDVEDPRNAKFISRLDYLVPNFDPTNPNQEACNRAAGTDAACGNTHSAKLLPGKDVLWMTDEYFSCPYGHLRMVDISDETQPRIISHFAYPENTACDPSNPGRTADPARFPRRGPSTHIGNTLGDDLLFLAWYGMGVRVFDIANPESPVETGHYMYKIDPTVPEFAGNDTYDVIFGPGGRLYASDGTSGLRVLRYTGPGVPTD
jgi:hypothetical protein